MYNEEIELIKEAYHYAMFFGNYSLAKERMGIDFTPLEKCPTIKDKYAMLKNIVKNTPPPISGNKVTVNGKTRADLQSMERLQRRCGNSRVRTQCGGAKKSLLYCRDTLQTGAEHSPCLTFSSSTAPTTNPYQSPKTALSTATFRTREQKHIKATKRWSSTMNASMTGRTGRHSRYS